MNLQNILRESEEELRPVVKVTPHKKQEFENLKVPADLLKQALDQWYEDFKPSIRQQHTKILQAVIEEVEGQKSEWTIEKSCDCEDCQQAIGYNQALSDITTSLKETLSTHKKEI